MNFYEDIENIAKTFVEEKFKQDIANRTGEGELLLTLDEDKPEKEAPKKLIHAFPSSLEYNNDDGQLPIQSAAWNTDSVGYVPLLAEQGVKDNVGGDDKRGGLILGDPAGSANANANVYVLQLLLNVTYDSNPTPFDTANLNIMKGLRAMISFSRRII